MDKTQITAKEARTLALSSSLKEEEVYTQIRQKALVQGRKLYMNRLSKEMIKKLGESGFRVRKIEMKTAFPVKLYYEISW